MKSNAYDALENWARVRSLFRWTGRNESDRIIWRLLKRYTVGAPLAALRRAALGHPQGAGRLRRKSAEAIVAPLLAVPYPGNERCTLWDAKRETPIPRAFREHLLGLTEHARYDLAEHWVEFLRRERDDPPAPWTIERNESAEVIREPCGSVTEKTVDLALLELRLVEVALRGEALRQECQRAASDRRLAARLERWLEEQAELLEQIRRFRRRS